MSEPLSPSQSPDQNPSSSNGWKGKWKETYREILSFFWAVLIIFAIRSSVIEPFKIPSGSMIPTLLVGDQIFVNKFAYGLRVPFTDWIGEKSLYFFRNSGPKRGDIIVFKYPVDPSIYYIKRIVAIPGDTLYMKDKIVYVNDKPYTKQPIDADETKQIFESIHNSPTGKDYTEDQMKVSKETFDDTTATIMVNTGSYFSESFPPVTVPEGQFFVMGDNRDNSTDSRFWGFVPFDNIKGKAFVIWLNFWLTTDDQYGIPTGVESVRLDRIGTLLK